MAHCYYVESLGGTTDADSTSLPPGTEIPLLGDDARHAAVVARLRVGERILLGDGRGGLVHGEAVRVSPDGVTVRTLDEVRHEPARRPRLRLAQALAKGGRDELAIQTACELGVDDIIPWQAQRSIVKWRPDKAARQVDRWRSIVREASKQSMRSRIPSVDEPVTTAGLAALAATERVLLLDPGSPNPLTSVDLDAPSLLLVVGPEGGISPEELARVEAAGGQSVRLGSEVLRTSTAGPAALAALAVLLGRW